MGQLTVQPRTRQLSQPFSPALAILAAVARLHIEQAVPHRVTRAQQQLSKRPVKPITGRLTSRLDQTSMAQTPMQIKRQKFIRPRDGRAELRGGWLQMPYWQHKPLRLRFWADCM